MPYIKKADYLKLLYAGNALSNAAFNLKQMDHYLPEHIRKSLEEGQKDWDKALDEVRDE